MCKSDKAFITNGFSKWKKAELFTKHQMSDCHKMSFEAHRTWLQKRPIDQQLDKEVARQASARENEVSIANFVVRFTSMTSSQDVAPVN